MNCLHCDATEIPELIVLERSGFPPEHEQHQITYDHDVVYSCPSCGHATLEQRRHDCFDWEEVWDQYEWFVLEPADAQRLKDVVAQCEQPLVSNCICPTHKALRISARALPRGSWEYGFEHGAHYQHITFTADKKPQFHHVGALSRPERPAAEPVRDVATKKETSLWPLAITFPPVYALALWLYYRAVDWPWPADTLVVIAAIPAAFIVAVGVAALVVVIVEEARLQLSRR